MLNIPNSSSSCAFMWAKQGDSSGCIRGIRENGYDGNTTCQTCLNGVNEGRSSTGQAIDRKNRRENPKEAEIKDRSGKPIATRSRNVADPKILQFSLTLASQF